MRRGRADQDARDLGSAEGGRRQLARPQQLADLRSAEHYARLGRVRAGLGAGHALALLAVERVVEEQRRDAQLPRLEGAEDVVGVVGAVVAADAGVVAAD